jgi:prepilin-type N-terminal cleavage/methylation domain-containing protein
MQRNQTGFTLIEIAVVLVIIGLLLGGVLKGQELINGAKVKNLATDFRNIPVFIYTYQDKFRALPGDDANAVTHVGGTNATTATTLGNGIINGAWNDTTTASESFVFWQHIRLAGLLPGATDTAANTYQPTNAANGKVGIQSGTSVVASALIKDTNGAAIRGSYIICSDNIAGKFIKQLDITLDDGNTAGGMMMSVPTGSSISTTATATAAVDESASYMVCMGV